MRIRLCALTADVRLQQAAEPGEILLAESAYRLVRGSVEAKHLASLELKGKQGRVGAYRLVGLVSMAEPAPRLDAPLVGRQDTLAQLEWVLERAITKGAAVLFPFSGRRSRQIPAGTRVRRPIT